MRKVLAIIVLLVPFLTKAQSTSVFCVQTNCPVSITLPVDSATLYSAATITSDSIVSYVWKQTSGPKCTLSAPNASQTKVLSMDIAGTYTFSVTATSKGGAVQTVYNDIVTVQAAPAPYILKVSTTTTTTWSNGKVTTTTSNQP